MNRHRANKSQPRRAHNLIFVSITKREKIYGIVFFFQVHACNASSRGLPHDVFSSKAPTGCSTYMVIRSDMLAASAFHWWFRLVGGRLHVHLYEVSSENKTGYLSLKRRQNLLSSAKPDNLSYKVHVFELHDAGNTPASDANDKGLPAYLNHFQ